MVIFWLYCLWIQVFVSWVRLWLIHTNSVLSTAFWGPCCEMEKQGWLGALGSFSGRTWSIFGNTSDSIAITVKGRLWESKASCGSTHALIIQSTRNNWTEQTLKCLRCLNKKHITFTIFSSNRVGIRSWVHSFCKCLLCTYWCATIFLIMKKSK